MQQRDDQFDVVRREADDIQELPRPVQWSIGSLLLLTTIIAVTIAGFLRQGVEGALGAVFLSWLVVLGGLTFFHGLLRRPRSWIAILAGPAVAALGLAGWLTLVSTQAAHESIGADELLILLWQRDWWNTILLIAIGVGIWWVARPKWPITIVVGPRGVIRMEGIAAAKQPSVCEFLERDLAADRQVTIRAARQADGSLRVQVRGARRPEFEQRVRNYLNTVL